MRAMFIIMEKGVRQSVILPARVTRVKSLAKASGSSANRIIDDFFESGIDARQQENAHRTGPYPISEQSEPKVPPRGTWAGGLYVAVLFTGTSGSQGGDALASNASRTIVLPEVRAWPLRL